MSVGSAARMTGWHAAARRDAGARSDRMRTPTRMRTGCAQQDALSPSTGCAQLAVHKDAHSWLTSDRPLTYPAGGAPAARRERSRQHRCRPTSAPAPWPSGCGRPRLSAPPIAGDLCPSRPSDRRPSRQDAGAGGPGSAPRLFCCPAPCGVPSKAERPAFAGARPPRSTRSHPPRSTTREHHPGAPPDGARPGRHAGRRSPRPLPPGPCPPPPPPPPSAPPPHSGPVVAVDDVTLRVERGGILGILGANGGGKSTLIRLISTLLTLDAGRIEIFGL